MAEIIILEHGFDDGLAVVKGPLHGHSPNIGIARRGHEAALDLANPAIGEQDRHSGMARAAESLNGRTARIARGCRDDGHGPALSGQRIVIEAGQQLHGHILEGQGRAVEQFHLPDRGVELGQGGYGRMGEGGIGLGRHLGQDIAGDLITGKPAQHLGCDLGIGHSGEAGDLLGRKGGPDFRHIEAAIWGKTRQHGI